MDSWELPPPFYDSIEEYWELERRKQMNKKWYHSKTLYVNLIGAAVIIATLFGYEDVSAKILAGEGAILAIVNLVLRIITNKGLMK